MAQKSKYGYYAKYIGEEAEKKIVQRVNQAISNLKTDTKTKLLDRTLSDVMKKRYKAMGDEYYAKQADKALESALAENYVIGNIGIDTIITELNIDSIFTNIIEPGIKNAQQQIGHEVSKAFMSQYPQVYLELDREHQFNWDNPQYSGSFGTEGHYTFIASDGFSFEVVYDFSNKTITAVYGI